MVTVEMLRPVFAKAIKGYGEDQVPRLSAALAFYLLLALSPLLLVLVAVFTLLVRLKSADTQMEAHLLNTIRNTLGEPQMLFLKGIMDSSKSNGASYVATVTGLALALFGSSGLFQQLRDSVNGIWRAKPGLSGIRGVILSKIGAALTVIVVVAILVGWLVFDSWMRIVRRTIAPGTAYGFRESLSFVFAWFFWTPIYAAMFKWLPAQKVEWRDVWLGGIVTALAFAISKYVLSLYFSYVGSSASFGSAGAIIVILLWAYYSAQIFFYGVELTKAYAEAWGSLKEIGNRK